MFVCILLAAFFPLCVLSHPALLKDMPLEMAMEISNHLSAAEISAVSVICRKFSYIDWVPELISAVHNASYLEHYVGTKCNESNAVVNRYSFESRLPNFDSRVAFKRFVKRESRNNIELMEALFLTYFLTSPELNGRLIDSDFLHRNPNGTFSAYSFIFGDDVSPFYSKDLLVLAIDSLLLSSNSSNIFDPLIPDPSGVRNESFSERVDIVFGRSRRFVGQILPFHRTRLNETYFSNIPIARVSQFFKNIHVFMDSLERDILESYDSLRSNVTKPLNQKVKFLRLFRGLDIIDYGIKHTLNRFIDRLVSRIIMKVQANVSKGQFLDRINFFLDELGSGCMDWIPIINCGLKIQNMTLDFNERNDIYRKHPVYGLSTNSTTLNATLCDEVKVLSQINRNLISAPLFLNLNVTKLLV